jgi:hypothetical protein
MCVFLPASTHVLRTDPYMMALHPAHGLTTVPAAPYPSGTHTVTVPVCVPLQSCPLCLSTSPEHTTHSVLQKSLFVRSCVPSETVVDPVEPATPTAIAISGKASHLLSQLPCRHSRHRATAKRTHNLSPYLLLVKCWFVIALSRCKIDKKKIGRTSSEKAPFALLQVLQAWPIRVPPTVCFNKARLVRRVRCYCAHV